MAPSATEGGSISELNTVSELREWLFGRVGDDNDIVIDDLQEDFAEQHELDDEKKGIRVCINSQFYIKSIVVILGQQGMDLQCYHHS